MKLFHILTIIIAVSVFFGLFIYTFITFNKIKSFPPDITDCPDYWKVNKDGTCQIPKPGEMNLGNLDAVKDEKGNIVSSSKGREIYKYKSFEDGSTTYSYLPSYYDAISPKLLFGKKAVNLPLGYYQADIPYGYDSEAPQRGVVDFNDQGWASFGDPYCEIKKWATMHNIQWDGIANYNKC